MPVKANVDQRMLVQFGFSSVQVKLQLVQFWFSFGWFSFGAGTLEPLLIFGNTK